jgi:hypothetical protein
MGSWPQTERAIVLLRIELGAGVNHSLHKCGSLDIPRLLGSLKARPQSVHVLLPGGRDDGTGIPPAVVLAAPISLL